MSLTKAVVPNPWATGSF